MPVVVTGAGGMTGRAVLRHLRGSGGELRALVRRISEVPRVRDIVPKAASPDLEDTDEIALMLHDAHTVIHLHPEPGEPEATMRRGLARTTEWVLDATEKARVRRFVLVSCVGSRADAANPYQQAAAEAEGAVEASNVPERVIIRTTAAFGAGGLWLDVWRLMARPLVAVVPGSGAQIMAPVHVQDVAAAVVAADNRGTEVAGTFELEGPERLSLDDLIDRVSGRQRRKVHVSPRRASGLLRTGRGAVSVAAMDLLSRDWTAGKPSAAEEFGLRLTPLSAGLDRA